MIVSRWLRLLVALAALACARDGRAFHHDLAGVTAVTLAGDTDLPRIPPQGRRTMVLTHRVGGVDEIVSLTPFTTFGAMTPVSPTGRNPAVSYNGKTFAWEAEDDPLGLGRPGWQIVVRRNGVMLAGPDDPSGTSANPSLDKGGSMLAFESGGDLTGVGTSGVKRVYVYDLRTSLLQLASTGSGTSGNAMVSAKGRFVAFESTSDPVTGVDTGVSQVWAGSLLELPTRRVTSGAGPSTEPLVSDEGRLIAFSSTADLAGDGHDTGTKQVFVYDGRARMFAQLTHAATDPGGCGRPAVSRVRSDWRVTFVCGGQAYYHMLGEDRRYHVLTPGGTAQSIVPEMGVHFVMLSTTSDLYGGAPTAGNRIYLRNLFAQGADAAAGSATWFPE